MSRERPIIFSAPMVKAILADRKTQTRRIIKPQPPAQARSAGVIHSGTDDHGTWWWLDAEHLMDAGVVGEDFRCPYGLPGDRLWVRENWRPLMDHLSECTGPKDIRYAASVSEAEWAISKWRPSIHMPRWASRITLTITDVRVERVQSISDADAIAEGCAAVPLHALDCASTAPSEHFRQLWKQLNGADAWVRNDWVFAITFERVSQR